MCDIHPTLQSYQKLPIDLITGRRHLKSFISSKSVHVHPVVRSDEKFEEEELDPTLSVGSTVAFRVNLDFPICAPPRPLPAPKAPKIASVTSSSVTLEWTDAQIPNACAPVLKYEISYRGKILLGVRSLL